MRDKKKKKKKKSRPSRSKMARMTQRRSKTVISAGVSLKNKNQLSTKINKIAHYCNVSRIYFFILYVKEAVVAAAFIFELNIFQIFAPRNGILFCLLFVLQSGISNAICDLVLQLFREGIKISFRQYGAIPVQYLRQWKCIVLLWFQPETSLFS